VVGVAEVGVAVQRHLAVERLDRAVGEPDQRVDLDQRGVLLDEHLIQLDDLLRRGVDHVGGKLRRDRDLAGLGQIDTGRRVDRHLGDRVRVRVRDLLDLDTALGAGDRQVGAVGAVDQEREVILLGDAGGRHDVQLLDDVALDVQSEDGVRLRLRVGGIVGQLDASGLAPATGLDLRLDDHPAADPLGRGPGLLRGGGDLTDGRPHAVLGEQRLRLVLHQVHDVRCPLSPVGRPGRGFVRALLWKGGHRQPTYPVGPRLATAGPSRTAGVRRETPVTAVERP
jgi:hypothetical protein